MIAYLKEKLFGNFLTLLIFLRKNLSKMSKLLRILICFDSFGLLQIFQQYIKNAFKIDVRTLSDISCKIFVYFAYLARPLSAWLLVYICFERFIFIKHPFKYGFLKKGSTHVLFSIFIFIFNLAYYSIILIEVKIIKVPQIDKLNNSIDSVICYSTSNQIIHLFFMMDMVNSVFIPFILMILSTCLLILFITQSRSKIMNQNSVQHQVQVRKIQKNDFHFAFSSISLNIVFLILNLPVCLYLYITEDVKSETFFILDNLYYLNFCSGFFVHLFSNKIFREEFFIIVLMK